MLKLASLILRNVLRNKRRSFLTLASMVISMSLLTLLVGFYQGYFFGKDVSPDGTRRLVTRHKVSLTNPLPISHQQRIRGVEGVKYVGAHSWFGGKYKDDKPENFFARFAVEPETVFDIYPDWIIPPDQAAAFKARRTACMVGRKIAKDLKMNIGDKIIVMGDIYPVNLELDLVGIYDHPPNMEALVFHREYLVELLKQQDSPLTDMTGFYMVMVNNAADVPGVSADIDELFRNNPPATRTQSEKEFNRSFLAFLGNIQLFLLAICGAVTFTILLVSANTVAMSVRERTRELAILRTLGYTPFEILNLVLGESVIISLLGGMFGLGIGWLLGSGVETFAGAMGAQAVRWQGGLIVIAMAIIIGPISAIVPAVVASRKNVVESMRFVG